MTYSIFSIIANTVSESGCSAWTYALDAFQPYSRAPWYQFSEQLVDNFTANGGTNPAFNFLTGIGGFNQIGPFAWLGLRTDGPFMQIDPSLPPQIPHVKLRTFYYGGATLNAFLNYTHTTLTRSRTTNSFVNDTYGENPMPIAVGDTGTPTMLEITIGQTLTIDNRQYSSNLTIPDNLVQCQPATSPDEYAPGQYPLAAIDGATSTKWQPASPEKASVTVDLSHIPFQPILGLSFDWAAAPPMRAHVLLSNSSTFDGAMGPTVFIPIENITISIPYNALDTEIKQYEGNTTMVNMVEQGEVYSGRYAKLEIEGTQGEKNTTGATVAEFAMIGRGGSMMVRRWEKVEVHRRH